MTLTDRTIRNAKPRRAVYRIRDGNSIIKGFGITVAPAGSKTFFLGYTSPDPSPHAMEGLSDTVESM